MTVLFTWKGVGSVQNLAVLSDGGASYMGSWHAVVGTAKVLKHIMMNDSQACPVC
jgi:hypothetical protein